jgi:hypothetical protein
LMAAITLAFCSFGVVMWELLTLRPPWEGMDPFQLPVRCNCVVSLLLLTSWSWLQGLVGFKNQRLPLPSSAPPECPPMFLQIIREVVYVVYRSSDVRLSLALLLLLVLPHRPYKAPAL